MEQQPAEWMTCTTTVYVNAPSEELPIECGLRFDLPQFTTRGLDPSFWTELHLILAGRSFADVESERPDVSPGKRPLRQLASAVPTAGVHSIQVYECSDELVTLLATLNETRATDIAHQWRKLLWPGFEQVEEQSRCERRESVLMQLIGLAREAQRSNRKLLLRTEYRRFVRDATGRVSGKEASRH